MSKPVKSDAKISGMQDSRKKPAFVQKERALIESISAKRATLASKNQGKKEQKRGALHLHHVRSLIRPLRTQRESGLLEDDEYAAHMAGVGAMLTSPYQVYEFRLTLSGARLSSASPGDIIGTILWDLSAESEYNDLASLFTEVRIRKARVVLIPLADGLGDASHPIITFGSTTIYSGTNPATKNEVEECADARQFNLNVQSASLPIHDRTWDVTVPGDYLWAPVGTPAATVNAGVRGQFWYYTVLGGEYSKPMFAYNMEVVYQFRNRYGG